MVKERRGLGGKISDGHSDAFGWRIKKDLFEKIEEFFELEYIFISVFLST